VALPPRLSSHVLMCAKELRETITCLDKIGVNLKAKAAKEKQDRAEMAS